MLGRTRFFIICHFVLRVVDTVADVFAARIETESEYRSGQDFRRYAIASPDYFLNVPALLERMRKAVDEQLWKTGGVALKIYSKAKARALAVMKAKRASETQSG